MTVALALAKRAKSGQYEDYEVMLAYLRDEWTFNMVNEANLSEPDREAAVYFNSSSQRSMWERSACRRCSSPRPRPPKALSLWEPSRISRKRAEAERKRVEAININETPDLWSSLEEDKDSTQEEENPHNLTYKDALANDTNKAYSKVSLERNLCKNDPEQRCVPSVNTIKAPTLNIDEIPDLWTSSEEDEESSQEEENDAAMQRELLLLSVLSQIEYGSARGKKDSEENNPKLITNTNKACSKVLLDRILSKIDPEHTQIGQSRFGEQYIDDVLVIGDEQDIPSKP